MHMLPRSLCATWMKILALSSAVTTATYAFSNTCGVIRIDCYERPAILNPRRFKTFQPSYKIPIVLQSSQSNNEDEVVVGEELNIDDIPSSVSMSSQPQQQKSQQPLDPLFTAVTKMDSQTQRAETISVPIWGELILDRSLFVLIPIAVFAIGGIFLSLYVLINSSDTFVNAVVETAMKQSIPTTSTLPDGSDSCRGLCSSQAQDLEGLRSYMNRLGGK